MRALVNQYGPRKWSAIASHLPGRVGKQSRERYGLATFPHSVEMHEIFLSRVG
jgi:hypothetical protein